MNPAFPKLSQSSSDSAPETCKAALFKVANHWLALPATTILKVIPSSDLEKRRSELAVWNNCPLVRLHLHHLLSRSTINLTIDQAVEGEHQSLQLQPYTMIVWSQIGEYCGILVDQLPVLHDLSLSEAQVLPLHYRRMIHNLAKYMVIQPYQGVALNVLLLDLQQALQRATLVDPLV